MRAKYGISMLIVLIACFVVQPVHAIPQTPIDINDFAFSPATATEEAGVPITWTNKGGTDHTVTFDSLNIDSGDIPADGTFSTTIATPGSYSYHCTIHPS